MTARARSRKVKAGEARKREAKKPARTRSAWTKVTLSPFEACAMQVGDLVEAKSKAYGESFLKSGSVMKLLYPGGIQPWQFRDALAIVRIVDKLFRIATRKSAFGESPYRDIAGYGVLGAVADADDVIRDADVTRLQTEAMLEIAAEEGAES